VGRLDESANAQDLLKLPKQKDQNKLDSTHSRVCHRNRMTCSKRPNPLNIQINRCLEENDDERYNREDVPHPPEVVRGDNARDWADKQSDEDERENIWNPGSVKDCNESVGEEN
jgi:hypothetical protein